VAGNFYGRYLSGTDLRREAGAPLESFSATTAAQVQIFNARGKIILIAAGLMVVFLAAGVSVLLSAQLNIESTAGQGTEARVALPL
jgi:hypothetical protein